MKTVCWIFACSTELIWLVLVTTIHHLWLVISHRILKPVGIILSFLSCLPHFSKLNVVFIKNYLLDIMCWHLSHKQTLSVSIFISLNYFIFETQKLKYLWKHTWNNLSFLVKALWHLSSRLLSIDFNRFSSFPKLIKLPKYLSCFTFKFQLELFHSLNSI